MGGLWIIGYTWFTSSQRSFFESGAISSSKVDVIAAADAAVSKSDDLLRLNVSKTYNGNQVVDNMRLGIPRETLFALLGPNGAGKTTKFNIIRECGSS